MTSSARWTVLSLLLLLSFVSSAFLPNSNDQEWLEVSPTVSFQRSLNTRSSSSSSSSSSKKNVAEQWDGAINEALRRMLYSSSSSSKTHTTTDSAYANGMQLTGKEWSSYQLAWRLLGFYIDCSTEDKCQRMVMYAVYVDPNYEGGGFGEYEYYDLEKGEFVCYNNGSCRQKMDCHLTNTNWEMLGVFKINDISENNGWMEQLFKHEGVCVWGDDTYQFASQMREHLPYQCKQVNVVDPSTGNKLYYDVSPGPNATLGLALYTDNQCSLDYRGGATLDVYEIVGASETNFNQFNKDLDTWKICQPCIAYSVKADNYYCYDKAGYENCNQCMKFSAKAGCKIATARDIDMAERQATLVPFAMYGTVIGGTKPQSASRFSKVDTATQKSFPFLKLSILFFGTSCLLFIASSIRFKKVSRQAAKSNPAGDALMKENSRSPKRPRKNRFSPKVAPAVNAEADAEAPKSPASVETSPRLGKAKAKKQAPAAQLEWLSSSRSRSMPESNTEAAEGKATNEPTSEKAGTFLGDVANDNANTVKPAEAGVNLGEMIVSISRSASDFSRPRVQEQSAEKAQPFLNDDQNQETKPQGSPGAWIKGAMHLFKERRSRSLLPKAPGRYEV